MRGSAAPVAASAEPAAAKDKRAQGWTAAVGYQATVHVAAINPMVVTLVAIIILVLVGPLILFLLRNA
jgi:hypothetical protein